jgi:hypothetical protein
MHRMHHELDSPSLQASQEPESILDQQVAIMAVGK